MIYTINENTNEINEHDVNNINSLSKFWRTLPNREATQQERESYLLDKAKTEKISELKTNRNDSLVSPINTIQAEEITLDSQYQETMTGNSFYFIFDINASGIPSTEPSTLINDLTSSTNSNYYTRYSCAILDTTTRKGYVKLTKTEAENIKAHIKNRAETNVAHANQLEDAINACATISEIDAINITF